MQNKNPNYKAFRKIIKPVKGAINCEKHYIAQYIRENLTDEISEKLSITIMRNWYKKLFKIINNN